MLSYIVSPASAESRLPGCGHGPFSCVSQLMAHIESGVCIHIDITKIEGVCEKKKEFLRQLEDCTQEPVKKNYTMWMLSEDS